MSNAEIASALDTLAERYWEAADDLPRRVDVGQKHRRLAVEADYLRGKLERLARDCEAAAMDVDDDPVPASGREQA